MVTWSGIESTSNTDWIGMYVVGAPNTSYGAWNNTGGLDSGSLVFTAPDSVGQHEFRFLLNGGFTSVATSNIVTVRGKPNTHK